MEQDFPSPSLSLYVHIPFCLSRCGYCSFFSLPYSRTALKEYLGYLSREKELYADLLSQPLSSVYLGGGTPSLLSANEINELMKGLLPSPEAEITLETNPMQLTNKFLADLKTTAVNRLSIGLQSMDDKELAWLGRRHKASEMADKLKLCREFGYENYSLDFIYGLPLGIGSMSMQDNLQYILELNPKHLSCYLLSLEEDCVLYSQNPSLPEDEELAEQYEGIRQTLTQGSFEHYEISNFARAGYESKHNLGYWKGKDYLALGASAAGWVKPFRFANPADVSNYYQNIEQGIRFPDAEICSPEQEQKDWLMMGLRLTEGVSLIEFKGKFGSELESLYGDKITKLIGMDMLSLKDSRLALTEQAYFVSTSVIGELLS